MASSEYLSFGGFIQFEPEERQANGTDVRDIVIRPFGSRELLKITVWDGFEDLELERGDLVFVDGKYSQNRSQDGQKVYRNLSAVAIKRFPADPKKERGVVTTNDDEDDDLF